MSKTRIFSCFQDSFVDSAAADVLTRYSASDGKLSSSLVLPENSFYQRAFQNIYDVLDFLMTLGTQEIEMSCSKVLFNFIPLWR